MDPALAKRCFVETVNEIPGYTATGSIVPEEEPCFLCGVGSRATRMGALLKLDPSIKSTAVWSGKEPPAEAPDAASRPSKASAAADLAVGV